MQRYITLPSIFHCSRARLGLTCLAALVFSACASPETHELGYTLVPQDFTNEPTEPFFTEQASFVGRWEGEALDPLALDPSSPEAAVYRFASGSSRISLEIVQLDNTNGGSGLGGSLTFGEGEPPPPATDPDSGYPVGFSYGSFLSYDPESGASPGFRVNYERGLPPFEGFPYEIESVEVSGPNAPDGVLRMGYTTSDYVGSWCELQTPIAWPDGSFNPLPFSPGGREDLADGTNAMCSLYGPPDTSACPENFEELPPDEAFETFVGCFEQGPPVAVLSCDKIFLSDFCECTESSCSAGFADNFKSLMLRASGEELVGVFDGALFRNPRGLSTPIGAVRFRRVVD
jgi:hypothetical protein